MRQALKDSYLKIDADIKEFHKSKTDFSGSTLCTCIIKGRNLYVSNVGDSRTILISSSEILQLTRQQRPDDPFELARILMSGGRVFPLKYPDGKPNGPHRVWLPEVDFPGLAMSRSIGDSKLHQYGVTSQPDVVDITLKPNDRTLVIGSNGLFEYLSNQEVCDTIMQYYEMS